MRLIRQRRENDCGVAVVAMVAGVSYARALAAFTPEVQRRMTKLRAGTTTKECREALANLGWDSDKRMRPLRRRELKDIQGRALLAVRSPAGRRANQNWHWVAFLGEKDDYRVLDPATLLEQWVCDSYLRVWRMA